jgi:hypothetical protein
MAYAALPPPLLCLQLQAGQHAWEYLPRAARITVTEGSIVVHQRLWLASNWVHVPVTVRAGEQFQVTAGGWVEMEAKTTTLFHASAEPAWWCGRGRQLVMQRVRLWRANIWRSKLHHAA